MCRLYGFLSNEPTKVDCSLVFAQNALLLQSRVDEVGRDHADGWGIGTYEEGKPKLYKNQLAAFNDGSFSTIAEKAYSKSMVAHVRKATVGTPSIENTHPFSFDQFIFAHNGTVTGFGKVRDQLQQETDPLFQQQRRGTTDSEQYFLWLLTRLKLENLMNYGANGFAYSDALKIEKTLTEAVGLLASRCRSVEPDKIPKLNFVLTDGRTLVACRWNNSLHLIRRNGVYECKICGIPHVHHHESVDHQAVAIASEPITCDDWEEFTDHRVLVFTFE